MGAELTIKVDDIPQLNEKIKSLGFDLPTGLAFLPRNIISAKAKADLVNAETTSTVRVLFKKAGLVETPLAKEEKIPELALASFDWVGPTIFLASTLITQNPQIVDVLISVLSDYLTNFFKGIAKEQRRAELDIVTQTKSGSYKDIHYDGDVEGLKELPKIIRSLHDER